MNNPKTSLNNIQRVIKFFQKILGDREFAQMLLKLSESNSLRFISRKQIGHFYSPIPDFNEVLARADKIFDTSPKTIDSINLNEESQLSLLLELSQFYNDIPFQENKVQNLRYYFNNNFFSYGDAIILYSLLRYFKPKRLIEIGSGFSSALMLDTNEIFLNRETNFIFIEPYPERLFSLFKPEDNSEFKVITKAVQDVPISLFSELSENDILFIDSSHVGKIGSDVLHIISNILPSLKSGVIIHFHDILWPFQYPQDWLEFGFAWNESYFLKAFLQYNQAFEIIYFNSFMTNHHGELVQKNMPRIFNVPSSHRKTHVNTSLWLRKIV